MAHVRKGHLIRSPQWWKHLRDWKRVFWKRHRQAEREETMTRTVIDIGDHVECDFCGKDYTRSDAKGGLLFGSYGTCPDCAPRIEASAERYGEQDHIRARAGADETFKAFCLRLRGGNNTVTIIEG